MLILLVLLVVLGALLFFGVMTATAALGSRAAGPPIALVAAVAVAVVVALVGLTAGLGLVRSGPAPRGEGERRSTAVTTPPAANPEAHRGAAKSGSQRAATTPEPTRSGLGPRVRMTAGTGTGLGPSAAIGQLDPGTVLQIEASAFSPFATAIAKQCAGLLCGNHVEVHMSEAGTASFLFLVTANLAPSDRDGSCRITSPPCSLVLEDTDGEGRAQVRMLFQDAVPQPGQLRVTPARDLTDGTPVAVHLQGFPRGATARVVMCAAEATDPIQECGRPGLDVPVSFGARGDATVTTAIMAGPVGASRVLCGRGNGCTLAVISDDAFVRAKPVVLGFRAPPGASYDTGRLVVGLALAALFLLVAVVLVRRTDWSALGEEAAPEIDDAEYADLDAIVAALPPEPDLDELIAAMR